MISMSTTQLILLLLVLGIVLNLMPIESTIRRVILAIILIEVVLWAAVHFLGVRLPM